MARASGTTRGTSDSRAPAGRRIRGLDADQRREQRRQDLLDAALELVAGNGYTNTSIEQICQTAYVGTRSFYEVFDGKEACYIALLQQIAERIVARVTTVLDDSPADEASATAAVIGAFAHALVDDPRVARASFGEGAGISPAVERQRRINRRWAAQFLEDMWRRYGVADGNHLHRIAVGVVGGLFDLVVDWLHDADPEHPDVDALIVDLSDFYATVRRGLTAP